MPQAGACAGPTPSTHPPHLHARRVVSGEGRAQQQVQRVAQRPAARRGIGAPDVQHHERQRRAQLQARQHRRVGASCRALSWGLPSLMSGHALRLQPCTSPRDQQHYAPCTISRLLCEPVCHTRQACACNCVRTCTMTATSLRCSHQGRGHTGLSGPHTPRRQAAHATLS